MKNLKKSIVFIILLLLSFNMIYGQVQSIDSLNIRISQGGSSNDSVVTRNPANGRLRIRSLASIVNDIKTTNGISKALDSIQLGGALTKATVIATSATNTLALSGLQSGASTDSVLIANPSTGVIGRRSIFNLIREPWFSTATSTGATSNTDNIYQMGRVGIRTNTPTDTLDVNGTIRVRTLPTANSTTDNIVYVDNTGKLKKASQTGKVLNILAIDGPTMLNTVFNTSTYTDLISIGYVPVSNNSQIIVEYDNQHYSINGDKTDDFFSQLVFNNSTITENYMNINADRYRSSVLLPIKGVYPVTSSTSIPITIKVQLKRGTADDNITFNGTNGTLIITEIGN
jgi:hypothetical protein